MAHTAVSPQHLPRVPAMQSSDSVLLPRGDKRPHPHKSRPLCSEDSPVLDEGDDLRVGFPNDAIPIHLDQPIPCRVGGDSVTSSPPPSGGW